MKCLVLYAIIAYVATADYDADLEADRAVFKDLMNTLGNKTISAGDKKAKFEEAFTLTKEDYKAKYDELLSYVKDEANSLPTEASRKAANDLIALWENGTLFETKDKIYTAVMNIKMSLGDEDWHDVGVLLGKKLDAKFQALFKDIAPGMKLDF